MASYSGILVDVHVAISFAMTRRSRMGPAKAFGGDPLDANYQAARRANKNVYGVEPDFSRFVRSPLFNYACSVLREVSQTHESDEHVVF